LTRALGARASRPQSQVARAVHVTPGRPRAWTGSIGVAVGRATRPEPSRTRPDQDKERPIIRTPSAVPTASNLGSGNRQILCAARSLRCPEGCGRARENLLLTEQGFVSTKHQDVHSGKVDLRIRNRSPKSEFGALPGVEALNLAVPRGVGDPVPNLLPKNTVASVSREGSALGGPAASRLAVPAAKREKRGRIVTGTGHVREFLIQLRR
jgi:hypothetical protein